MYTPPRDQHGHVTNISENRRQALLLLSRITTAVTDQPQIHIRQIWNHRINSVRMWIGICRPDLSQLTTDRLTD